MSRSRTVPDSDIRIEIHDQIIDISADQWNRLVIDNQPFLRHEFLAALEIHQCVGDQFGWLPRHIAIYRHNHLVGAMPLYEKYNSYGEFVFDHAWADAYQRSGLSYFPKLVSSIPYTPATGSRLLSLPGEESWVFPALLQTALKLAQELKASSFHCLFPFSKELDWLASQDLLSRHDCQFHWRNRGYQCFDDFLQQLNNRKRKKIKQERRRVVEAGVKLKVLNGHSATSEQWALFADFYRLTFEEKWGIPTLNYGFFQAVAQALPDQVVLVLAELDGQTIAGALMFCSDNVLYGRHWGCSEQVDFLHFEACYYQGIEFAIKHGLQVFEPGAQGEHKVARGFVPTLTRSSHWLADSRYKVAIEQFCQREHRAVIDYMEQVDASNPYK